RADRRSGRRVLPRHARDAGAAARRGDRRDRGGIRRSVRALRALPVHRLRTRQGTRVRGEGGAPRRPARPGALEELSEAAARARDAGTQARRPCEVRAAQGVAALLEGAAEGCVVVAVAAARMHDDELVVEIPLVRRLVAAQFPEWADLPLERVLPAGTDNAIF